MRPSDLRSHVAFQPLALVPIIVTVLAFMLSIVCFVAGSKPGVLTGYAMFTMNVSRMGEGIFHSLDNEIMNVHLKRDEPLTSTNAPPPATISSAPTSKPGLLHGMASHLGQGLQSDASVMAHSVVTSDLHPAESAAAAGVHSIVTSKVIHPVETAVNGAPKAMASAAHPVESAAAADAHSVVASAVVHPVESAAAGAPKAVASAAHPVESAAMADAHSVVASAVVHPVESAAAGVPKAVASAAHPVESAAASDVHSAVGSAVRPAESVAVNAGATYLGHLEGNLSQAAGGALGNIANNTEGWALSAISNSSSRVAAALEREVALYVRNASARDLKYIEALVQRSASGIEAAAVNMTEHIAGQVARQVEHYAVTHIGHIARTLTKDVTVYLAKSAVVDVQQLTHLVAHGATAVGAAAVNTTRHAFGGLEHAAGFALHTAIHRVVHGDQVLQSRAKSLESAGVAQAKDVVSDARTAAVNDVNAAYHDFIKLTNITDWYGVYVSTTCWGRYVYANGTNVTVADGSHPDAKAVHQEADGCVKHIPGNPVLMVRFLYICGIFSVASLIPLGILGAVFFTERLLVTNIFAGIPAFCFLFSASSAAAGATIGGAKMADFAGTPGGVIGAAGTPYLACTFGASVFLFINMVMWIVLRLRFEKITHMVRTGEREIGETESVTHILPPPKC